MTRSGEWEICAVPGRFLDNQGELAYMLSHNRLIIIYDVGMCSYHMMKLMKMVSTLQYHTNSNMTVYFVLDGAITKRHGTNTQKKTQHHKTIVNQK